MHARDSRRCRTSSREEIFDGARVYFAGIAKLDYLQSHFCLFCSRQQSEQNTLTRDIIGKIGSFEKFLAYPPYSE